MTEGSRGKGQGRGQGVRAGPYDQPLTQAAINAFFRVGEGSR
jgi:hypothetical protein